MRIDDASVRELLSNQQFINGHALEILFNELAAACESLRRPEDSFRLPEKSQLYGGKAMVELYVRLKSRERNTPQRGDDPFLPGAAQNYANYLRDREAMKGLLYFKKITSQEAAYLGLESGDLDDLKADERGLIPIDAWADRAYRISIALGKFQSFTGEEWEQERLRIPHALAQRRLEQREAELEIRLSALESVKRTNNDETENAA